MKLVREHIIFEKFTDESDPIRDMGIGKIPYEEVLKISKAMEHRFNELFPENKASKWELHKYKAIPYYYALSIDDRVFNMFELIRFCGSIEAAKDFIEFEKLKMSPKIGWYINYFDEHTHESSFLYFIPNDYENLLKEVLKQNFLDKENDINKKIGRLKKRSYQLQSALITAKKVKKYLGK